MGDEGLGVNECAVLYKKRMRVAIFMPLLEGTRKGARDLATTPPAPLLLPLLGT